MINWHCSKEDFRLIVAIAERIEGDIPALPGTRAEKIMDLNACHSNGCPLQLAELLAADKGDFAHDVIGIYRHIDRETGRMTGCFLPRYAQQEVTA